MKVLVSSLALAVIPALAAPIAESAGSSNAASGFEVSTVESLPGDQEGTAWLFSATKGPLAGQGTTLKFYEKNDLVTSGKGRAWVLEIDDSVNPKNSGLARYATQFRPLPQGRQGAKSLLPPPPPRPFQQGLTPAPANPGASRPQSGQGIGAGTLAGQRLAGTSSTSGTRAPSVPNRPNAPAAPAQPAAPRVPAVPAQPAAPRVPAQPAAPRVPAQPAAPKVPAQPAQPAAPRVPAVPASNAVTPALVSSANVAPESPEQLPDIGGLLGSLPPLPALPPLPDIGGLLGSLPDLSAIPVVGPLLGGAKSGGAPAAPPAPAGGAAPGSITALTTQIGEQIGDRIGEPIGSAIGSRIGKAIGQPIGSTIGGAIGNAITGFLPAPKG